jgi:hypothetical protein
MMSVDIRVAMVNETITDGNPAYFPKWWKNRHDSTGYLHVSGGSLQGYA